MILLCITAPGREYRLTKLTELDSFLAYAEEGRASQVALVVKNLPANAGLIPELEDPLRRHGNPFQYSCLKNPMDKGAWWATVRRVTKSQTRLK